MRSIILAIALSSFLVTWIKDGGLAPYISDIQPLVVNKAQVLGTSTRAVLVATSTTASSTSKTVQATTTIDKK